MTRRIKNIILFMLVFSLMIMITNYVNASYHIVGFEVTTHGYYGEDQDFCEMFDEKVTDDYMQVYVSSENDSLSKLDFKAMGANTRFPKSPVDCSDGHVYRLGKGEYTDKMINYVYENGYKYAGIKAQAVDDALVTLKGVYISN